MDNPNLTTHNRSTWSARFFSRLQRYSNLLARRWWVLLLCAALAAGAEGIYILIAPPSYASIGQMIVSIKLNNMQSSPYLEDQANFLGTQAALMEGSEVLDRARDTMITQFPGHPLLPVSLDVSILPRTTIFILKANGQDPKYTQAYLQACMNGYIDLKKTLAVDTSDTTIAGLTDQIQQLDLEMERSDDQVADYLETNGDALLQEETGVNAYLTILYQEIAQSESEYDLLQSMTLDQNLLLQQDSIPITMDNIASPSMNMNGLPAAFGLPDQSSYFSPNSTGSEYLGIKQQILLLNAEKQRLGQYLKDGHPSIVALDEETNRMGQLLSIYRDQSVEQLDARKHALQLQIQNLKNQMGEMGKENLILARKSAEYNRLQARSSRLEDMYDSLLATLETLDVDKDVSPDSVTVYQPATDALPDNTLYKKALPISGVLGFILGLGILLLMDRVDDRMNTFTELQELFDEDVLGQIPRERKSIKDGILPFVKFDDQRHPFVESYRNLRSSLVYMAQTGTRPHTLLVTSAVPNDGKSITATNLAITLAMGGSRVLLVDSDLRKGNLHNRLKVPVDIGLSEVLSDGVDWHTAVKETTVPNLRLLPRGTITQRSSEFFMGPVMAAFLQESKKEYDYVLIDTAPVMAADDVTSLAPLADGVVFVVRAEFTSARVARASLDMLYQRKARVLGLVFNSVRATVGDYYYYYRYHDYYSGEGKK